MEDSSASFQAGWNLAEPMIWDISNRLKSARDYFLDGNIEKYYWNLDVIVRIIHGFLNPEEKEMINIIKLNIRNSLTKIKTPENKKLLSSLVEDYDNKIMFLLHEHKFLVPPKKDRTRLMG